MGRIIQEKVKPDERQEGKATDLNDSWVSTKGFGFFQKGYKSFIERNIHET
jgi:hypothetical protein